MKESIRRSIMAFAASFAVLLGGCVGAPETVDDSPASDESAPSESLSEPVAVVESEPEPIAEPELVEPEPNNEESIVLEEIDDPGPIEVSEELYDQTFTEVEMTIAELNQIVADRNFDQWQRYLTEGYRRTYSDPDVLARSSQATILLRNNIRLRSLEDFFRYVVVPSRSNARLDDLVFRDEETVEAIMEVGDQRYLLYLLKKEGDRWKIDIF
ncbi:MAG: hypothetical protein MI724_05915 [Spirochaetales bacterium]|nr:hypothetical protein [Spirochaetales bacterium]